MKLLLDMNLPPRLAESLTSKGISAKHWYFIGASDAPDVEIIAYAKEHDYTVLTCDLDFSTILSITHGQKPSVIQIRVQDIYTEQLVALITAAVSRYSEKIESGAILSLDAKKARLRILPL